MPEGVEKNEFHPKFKFRVEIDEENGRVRLFDGAEQFAFILRNGEPFIVSRPLHKVSDEKMQAMTEQAAGILGRLKKKYEAEKEEK